MRKGDETSLFGYRNEDYFGQITRQDFKSYTSSFKYDCWINGAPGKCQENLEKNIHVYDSEDYFLDMCEPVNPRLEKAFPAIVGYNYIAKVITIGLPLLILNACIAAILM